MNKDACTSASRVNGHILLLVACGAVLVSLLVPAMVPVFFREDDVYYLEWARTHGFLDCFRPSQAVLLGMFRPVQNVAWWILYHACGLNPYPYHVVLLLSYIGAQVLFFCFARTAFSLRVAVGSMIAYGLFFHSLTYIVFWFSDFTYTLELLFAHAALWLFALATRRNSWRHAATAFGLYIAAAAAKEPAALLVPLVCGQMVISKRECTDARTRGVLMLTAVAMFVWGVGWLTVTGSLASRQGGFSGQTLDEIVEFVASRWSYYAGTLTAAPTFGVWAAVLFLLIHRMWTRVSRSNLYAFYGSCAVAIIGTLLLKMVPGVALLVLLAGLSVLVVVRDAGGIGGMWALPALVGVMSVTYVIRTYLVESSFGLALVCGVAGVVCAERFGVCSQSEAACRIRRIIVTATVVGVVIMGGAIAPRIVRQYGALKDLSDNRRNFGNAVEYVMANTEEIVVPLLVIDYEDMGLKYEQDLLRLPEGEKAVRQKTMTSVALGKYLSPASIVVGNLRWWEEHPEVKQASVLTMNALEEDFLGNLGMRSVVVHEWTRGEMRARLFRLSRD